MCVNVNIYIYICVCVSACSLLDDQLYGDNSQRECLYRAKRKSVKMLHKRQSVSLVCWTPVQTIPHSLRPGCAWPAPFLLGKWNSRWGSSYLPACAICAG